MIKKKEPLVSIGIPCYNRPEGLRRTLEYITGQTYRNLEIIVSDNCSPNIEIEKVGREYAIKDKRVQYIKQDTNIGAMNNFRFLVENSSRKYFLWAADDDLLSQSYIERCIEYLQKNIDYGVVLGTPLIYSNSEIKSTFSNRRASFGQNSPFQRVLSTYLATGPNLVAICGVIIKKQLDKIPIIDVFGADRHIMASLAFFGKIKMLEDIHIVRKIGVSSCSPQESHIKMCEAVGWRYHGVFFTRFLFALGAAKNIFSATTVYYGYPFYKKILLSLFCFFGSIMDTLYYYYIMHYRRYIPPICNKIYHQI